jgi:hypothetical protein
MASTKDVLDHHLKCFGDDLKGILSDYAPGAVLFTPDWRDVRIVLDRREGERRTAHDVFVRTDRRRVERRHRYPHCGSSVGQWSILTNMYRDSLLTDLAEFVQNHRPHGALTADATEPAWWNGYLLTFACLCDATLKR